MADRIEILIPYYYDPEGKSLYASPEGGKAVRTQFFSGEQTRAFHRETKYMGGDHGVAESSEVSDEIE